METLKLGQERKELRDFVAEQQERERVEREKQREARKMEMEMAARRMELEAEERGRQATEKARENDRQHELQMRQLELQSATDRLGVMKVSQPIGGVVAKMPELPKFIDGKDDLDSYLQRFERFARSSKWEQDSWSTLLSALLTGRALDVYSRMSETAAVD